MTLRFRALFALAAMLALSGCLSAGPYTFGPEGPLPCERSTCGVDLAEYRSVQERAAQDSDIVIVVAISGGGQRAGNFGTGVLLGLEEIKAGPGDLLDEVDYFSTVSGGGRRRTRRSSSPKRSTRSATAARRSTAVCVARSRAITRDSSPGSAIRRSSSRR
jgi:hypothetical protein